MTSPGIRTTTTITPGWRRPTATASCTKWRPRFWLYDPATDRAHEVPVEVGHPRTQRQPRFVAADRYLSDYQLDPAGSRVVLNTRGKLFTLAPFGGPVVQLGASQGVRYRLSSFLGDKGDIATVSDASGVEAVEVHRLPGEPGNGRGHATVEALDIEGARTGGGDGALA